MRKSIAELAENFNGRDLDKFTDTVRELCGYQKYKNLETGEINNLFSIGYNFMEDSFKFDKNTANPVETGLEYIIKEGKSIVKQGGYKKIKEE